MKKNCSPVTMEKGWIGFYCSVGPKDLHFPTRNRSVTNADNFEPHSVILESFFAQRSKSSFRVTIFEMEKITSIKSTHKRPKSNICCV